MTGFAQVRSTADGASNGQPAFTLSLKSVNHRYLDLQMRMPSETDALEVKLRRLLKEKINRGHVDLTLSIERANAGGMQLNARIPANVTPGNAVPVVVSVGDINSRTGVTMAVK